MAVIKLDSNNFNDEIKEGVVLVDFYADWCAPCKMIAPFLDEVALEKNDVKICKLNIDEAQVIATRYHVMSVPTLIVFKDGELVDQKMGFMTKEQILTLLG